MLTILKVTKNQSLSIILKKKGVIKRVRKIEKIMPDINTIPIVSLDSKPAPEPITRGTTPTTVDIPVIIIGLNLILHAEIKDSYDFLPIDLS